MAQKILVETWGDFGKIENLQEIMPVEMQMAYDLRDKGIMDHLMVKDVLKGAYILYNLTDKKEVETLLKKFPLYPYFERIEMALVEQSF
ncbi:MAG: hypothetical protein IJT35_01955 [Paludibacteraceae bacterium]|nr:hypothetical protein [Paludibacteraceae bacterium]